MEQELEDILTGLETNSIDAIGERPPGDPPTPQGPSHAMTSTKGGLLTPMPLHTRLTDNWIYTPDDAFPATFFNDADFAAVVPQVAKPQICRRCRDLSLWSIECNFMDSQSGLETKSQEEKCKLCQLLSYCIRDRLYSPRDAIQFSRVGSYLTIDDGKEQPVVNLCTVPGS
ncbi:hypothetical protein QQZ08_011398 [Neonectria magnoliae]|uniref:Uncharacterized protein n=1 Tax=Neonectria magnoliae TaxID=2732573 RepID=A0ABR1HAB8_9HYPO